MGVDESSSSIFSEDVTGSTVISPATNRRDAFSKVQVRAREGAQLGDSTSMQFGTGIVLRPLFGIGDDLRRFRAAAPTNGVFQAGPFYLQFYDLTGALLVSDNVNFTPKKAKWGAIAEFRLRMAAILQINPTWRLIVSGSIIYLPFKNEFGVEGFGIGDAAGFIADETIFPVTHMQLAYNSMWADWQVQMADDFSVRYFSVGGDYDIFVRGAEQPEGLHAEDQAGRYVFANGTTIPNRDADQRQRDFLDIRTFLQLQNTVAGTASRLLPTETRLTFGASHSDFWYHGGWDEGTNGLGFSNFSADRVFASLRNERESMRFKPFAWYEAYRYNYDPDWIHQFAVGITGPISDYLWLYAEGGYMWSDALLQDTWFYRARLDHTLGPYTKHSLSYSRVATEPVREIRDTYRYTIHQILGPDLTGRLYAQRSVFQPNQFGVYESVEDRLATRVIWHPHPNHTYIVGGAYAENRFADPGRDRETTWEARAEVLYRFSPTIRFSLLYRYLNINTRQSKLVTDTAENLWIFSARKLF
jgi:hypothetical protein